MKNYSSYRRKPRFQKRPTEWIMTKIGKFRLWIAAAALAVLIWINKGKIKDFIMPQTSEELSYEELCYSFPSTELNSNYMTHIYNSSPEALNNLTKCYNPEVRRMVAINRNTLLKTLEYLAKDENKEVRADVALNRNTPLELLTHLAKDEDKEVRSSVAINPNTSLELLVELIQDDSPEVRSNARLNYDIKTYKNWTEDDENWEIYNDQEKDVTWFHI